jgi:hypothetical protein
VIGDADYLKALSGAKQRGVVRAWCRKNGIKTFNNKDGWPVTTVSALDRALMGGVDSGPDWSAFDDKKAQAATDLRKKRALLPRREEQMDEA